MAFLLKAGKSNHPCSAYSFKYLVIFIDPTFLFKMCYFIT